MRRCDSAGVGEIWFTGHAMRPALLTPRVFLGLQHAGFHSVVLFDSSRILLRRNRHRQTGMMPTDSSSSSLPLACAEGIVFVVDDDLSVLRSLKLLISYAGWQPALCASAKEFLALPRVAVPSCLVLDVGLPDINGLELQNLVADRIEMPIIFITGDGDVPVSVQAMKSGAVEFLTKPFEDQALLNAIREALERSNSAICQRADVQALRDCYGSLTHREREVMGLVVSGRLNKQVGAELGISEITVKVHRRNMMEKMHANSFLELIKMASRLGLLPATKG